jgi:hypothetical protein
VNRRVVQVGLVALVLCAAVGVWQLVEAAGEVWTAVRAGPAEPAPFEVERPARAAPSGEVRVIDVSQRVEGGTIGAVHERRREARRAWRASLEPEERVRLREERRQRREALGPEEVEAQQARKLAVRSVIEGDPGLRAAAVRAPSPPAEPPGGERAGEAPDVRDRSPEPVTPDPAPR